MQKLLSILLLSLIGLHASLSAGNAWMTDYAAAKIKAASEQKPLLLEFTGSDWCPPCMRLNKEVFSQVAFLDYAAEELVIVKLDFPRKKAQSAELKAQNIALRDQFGIRGYPTVLLVNAEGKLLAQTGYRPGGAEAYVEHLKGMLASKK